MTLSSEESVKWNCWHSLRPWQEVKIDFLSILTITLNFDHNLYFKTKNK